VRVVEGQRVIKMEHAMPNSGVVGKYGHQARLPLAAEVGAEARHQVHRDVEVDLVESRGDEGVEPAFESAVEVLDHRAEFGGDAGQVHG